MKKYAALMITFLLLSTTILSVSTTSAKPSVIEKIQTLSKNTQNLFEKLKNNIEKHRVFLQNKDQLEFNELFFRPEDIELKDDAFHGADLGHYTEWWYFDAIFDNGYSLHVGIQMFNVLQRYFVLVRLNIYKGGDLILSKEKICLMGDFYTSYSTPLVKIDGKQIMNGYIDPETDEWKYDLSLEFNDMSTDLHFVGTAKGFKGKTQVGGWAVILPRADVTGNVTINNCNVQVKGVGYHDHNWETTVRCGVNYGWLWGKINSESYTVIWALIMKTRITTDPLLVISNGVDEYVNINPNDIKVLPVDYRLEDGKLIPFKYILSVDTEDISLYVSIEVLGTHHVSLGPFLKYWRCQVKCKGTISFGSFVEIIDEEQIAECIRFR